MPISGQIAKELNFVIDEVQDTIQDSMIELYDDIRNETPEDTGNLQLSWSYNRPTRYHWTIETNSSSDDYASVIWAGRRNINGKWYGSTQGWGAKGGQYLLDQHMLKLQKDLNAI